MAWFNKVMSYQLPDVNSFYKMLVHFCYCSSNFNNSALFISQTVANNPIE